VALSLDRANALEALSAMEGFSGEPVLVHAVAIAALRCVTVTVREPAPLLATEALEKLATALGTAGLRVDHAAGRWIIDVNPDRPPPPCHRPAPPTRASDVDGVLAEIVSSVHEVSPLEHTMSRRAADLVQQNSDILLREARIVPEQQAGKRAGIRLFGVRPDGLASHLGFENGDLVTQLQGKSVADPASMLDALQAIKTSDRIEFQLQRKGAPVKLVVRIE
jgi:hypothetical protein